MRYYRNPYRAGSTRRLERARELQFKTIAESDSVCIGDKINIMNVKTGKYWTCSICCAQTKVSPSWNRGWRNERIVEKKEEQVVSDAKKGVISEKTPLAQAVLGKKVGQFFDYVVEQSGRIYGRVVGITKPDGIVYGTMGQNLASVEDKKIEQQKESSSNYWTDRPIEWAEQVLQTLDKRKISKTKSKRVQTGSEINKEKSVALTQSKREEMNVRPETKPSQQEIKKLDNKQVNAAWPMFESDFEYDEMGAIVSVHKKEEPLAVNSTKKVFSFHNKKDLEESLMVLEGLFNGYNVFTGEIVEGLDDEMKEFCFLLFCYFERKLKAREMQDRINPNRGARWTKEEDELLMREYNAGKTVEQLSRIFMRSNGAIRARLLRFINIK